MSARQHVLALIDAAWTTQALHAACALGLPDLLADEARDAGGLAAQAGADADAVHRLLRALATLDLCVERDDGRFALSEAGALLRSRVPGSLAAWARMSGARLGRNWGELAESVRTGASARARRGGPDDVTALQGAEADAFNAAMTDLTRPVAVAAARELEWGDVQLAVDVGGGCGALLAPVLARHASLRGIVFDLPHAAPAAHEYLERAGVAARARFVAGSFFDALPEGGDAYLLKSVLHNWPDDAARGILRRCAAALAPGARVHVLERVLPEKLGARPSDRDLARSDLNMLVGCGGRERSEREFAALFAGAGLRLRAVKPLVGGFSALTAAA